MEKINHFKVLQLVRLIILISGIGVFFTSSANAQDTLPAEPAPQEKEWSLKECITYALDHNIQVKQQMLNIESSEKDLLQSKLDVLPDLNGYASHSWNWGQTIDRFTNDFATERVRSNNFYAQSTMTLFNGFQKYNSIKRDQLSLEASRYDTDKFMDDISISIASSYLEILYNEELLEVAKSQLEVTQQQVDRTTKMVEAGSLAKGDLLTVQAQAATEELSVVEAENALIISYLNLTQLLDLPTPEGFRIEKPEMDIAQQVEPLPKPQKIYNFALGHRPEIKSAKANVEVSDKNLSISRGMQSPNLYISGSWGTGYSGANKIGVDPYTLTTPIGYTESGETVFSEFSDYRDYETKPFGDQLDDNNNQTFGFNLNIPIFNNWQTRTSIEKSKIALENSKLQLESEKLNLYKTIYQAYADALAALKKYRSAMKQVEATLEAFDYAEQKFNVGLITSLEYNQAKNDLTNAQAQMVNSKYDYVFKTTILDFYMGKPLTLGE